MSRWLVTALAVGLTACTGPNPAYRKARVDGGAGDGGNAFDELPGTGGLPNGFGGVPGLGGVGPGGTGGADGGGEDLAPPVDTGGMGTGGAQPGTGGAMMTGTGGAMMTGTGGAGTPDAAADLNPPADARTTDKLVAAFSFNGSTTDPYGNTAVTHNTVFRDDRPPSAPATAQSIELNGMTSYIELNLATYIRSDAPKTIALWFKSTTNTPQIRDLVLLATKMDEITDLGIQVGLDGDSLAFWRYGRNPEGATTAMRNVWHHATYTFSGNAAGGTHRLFLDGALRTTVAGRNMSNGTRLLDRVAIGTYDPSTPNNLPEAYRGRIADVRIYDRLLSDAEILVLARP